MSNYCVLVADSSRARLFTLEPNSNPEIDDTPCLVERRMLENQEATEKGTEIWSDSKGGYQGAQNGSGAHTYDDHRDRHRRENEKRFARDIAQEALTMARKVQARNLVVVANDKTLGHLRSAINHQPNLQLRELPKDLSRLSARDIQSQLTREKVIPKRVMPLP